MVLKILTPKQSLNKAYQKVTVFRDEFNLFRKNLSKLLSNIDHEESEENVKNHLKDFLSDTYYKDKHLLNTKNKTDLVIYLDKKQDSKAGVLIEVKRPSNKGEMITKEDLNRKALHELILYYLQERIEGKNDEIKYLITTNIYEWFIFDAVLFENLFYKNTQLVKDYNNWKNDRKVSSRTDHFYNEIAKPYLDKLNSDITFTHFDLNDYKKLLDKADKESEKKFIPLYKILSPVHLIKQPFANDSNSLDRNFYNELLHIIGLEEVKVKNKKLINRKSIGERDAGSLIENTIQILKTDQAIDRIKEPVKYGEQVDDQLYHVALELSLTWINRILFLKLLESQLFNYHKSNNYKFLNSKKINDYDELYKLFHQVLAVRLQERADAVKDKYTLVPYLNSSLFEISDLENQAIRISQLDNNAPIKIYKVSVLKDKSGKKRTGTLTALEYLFEFLDAYNFTSEGKEEIEEEKKTLINASVLGLIFEKINGYKDGSYFTPGFITMYMCRETIRRAVVQKFNEKYEWNCGTFDDLKNHIAGKRNTKDIIETNEVVNSLKICDPAVGSGHFLVSALNEIIAIKSELGILANDTGVLLSGYDVKIENDELIVTYNNGEELFEYHPPQKRAAINQQVQETLFREKQTIIENCLFGVDINPNSVSIARLRLWIELLKNAYYTKESNYTELETLPNIDINIKEGNSLVSRFKLTEDIFTSADKTAFEVYKMNVNLYKNEHNREKRKQLKSAIDKTRERIKGIGLNPVKELEDKISALTKKMHDLNRTDMFEEQKSKAETEKIDKKRSDLTTKLDKLIAERNSKLEEYKILYSNAFEWRFEFPEALDEEGKYIGFDAVIGNPPYIRGDEIKAEKKYFETAYQVYNSTADIYTYFYELSIKIINQRGFLCLITSNKFIRSNYGKQLRKYLGNNHFILIIDFGELPVFDEASTFPMIILISKNLKSNETFIFSQIDNLDFLSLDDTINGTKINLTQDAVLGYSWMLVPEDDKKLLNKINANKLKLIDYVNGEIKFGIKTGLNEAYIVNKIEYERLISEDNKSKEIIKPFLDGNDVRKYCTDFKNKYLIVAKTGIDIKKYKAVYNHLLNFKSRLEKRSDKGKSWYDLRPCSYYDIFDSPKILYPDIALESRFTIDVNKYYPNATLFIIPSDDAYLLGLLNSKLIWYYLSKVCPVIGTETKRGRLRLKTIYLSNLPIVINSRFKSQIELLVKHILKRKQENQNDDTTKLESEIDELVYKLYGLTEEEIRIVEGK